jgi:CheY-like chemotaxis protein
MYDLIYVDDDPDDLEFAQLAFEIIGWSHRVLLLDSGKKVLQYLSQLVDPLSSPYLLLIDYYLDGMDGEDLLVILRSNPKYSYIKVVFLTTGLSKSSKDRLLKLGAGCCVDKPDNLEKYKELALNLKLIAGEIGSGQKPSFELLGINKK